MHSDSAADVAQSTTLPTPPSGQRAVKKHVEKQKMTNLSPQRTNKVKNSEFKLHRSPHRLTKRPSAPKSTRKRDRALTAQDLTLKARSLPATVKTTCASAPSSLRKASGECERHSSVLRPLSKRQNLDGDAEDARPRVAAGGSGSREQQSPWMQTARPHCALTVKIKRTRLKALDQEISNGLGESQRPLPTTNVNHKSGSPCRRNPLKKHLPTSTTQKQPQETVPQSSCSLLSPQSSLRNIQTAHMGNSPQLSDGSPVHMDCDSRESTNTESAVQLMGSLFITEERMASMDVSHTQEKNEDQYSQDNSTSEEPNSNALSEKSQAEELNSLGAPSKTKEPTLEQPPGKYLTDACVLVEGSHNKNVLQNEEQQDTDVAPSTHNRTTFVEDTALVLKHKENCKQGEGEKPTTQNMCAEIKLKEEGSSTQIAFTDLQKLQDQCDQPCTQKINSQAKEQRTMESNSSITPRGTQDQGGKGYGPISETMLSNVGHRDNDEKLSSRRGPKEVDRQSNQGTSLSLKITLEASCVNQIQSTQTKTNMERLTLSKEQQYFTTQSANSNGVTITTDSANSKSITGFNNNEEISNVCSDLPKRSHGLLDKVELLGQSYDLSLIRQSHESVVTYRGLDDHPIYIPKLNLQFTPDNSVDVSSLSKLNMNSINVADLQSGAITNSFNRTALSRTVVDISESHIYTDNGKRACSCPARCSNEAHSHPIHKIHPLHRIVDLSLSFTGNLAKDVPEGIPKILLTEEDADED